MNIIDSYKKTRIKHNWIMSVMIVVIKVFEHPINVLLTLYCRKLPVKNNYLLFEGKLNYSDNPKALCEYLIHNGYLKRYKIFYIVKDVDFFIKKTHNLPIIFLPNKNLFGMMPLRTMRVVYTASYTFASHSFSQPKGEYKEGQRHILLWHGCGYKGQSSKNSNRFFDLALVPGKLFVDSKCRYWNTTSEYIMSKGYPRYDWLINPRKEAKNYIEQWKKKINYNKVVIWMPTFRNSKVSSEYSENVLTQFPLMEGKDRWQELNKVCKDYKILLIIKLHVSQRNIDVNFQSFDYIHLLTNDDIESKDLNLYEFIAYTDALITDYSSIAIDYLILNRPMAFILDDYEKYKNTRGFIFDNPKQYMPGHHIYKFNDLTLFIKEIANNIDLYVKDREAMTSVALYNSSCYCKTIVNELNIVLD